jgi:hypothetical protein
MQKCDAYMGLKTRKKHANNNRKIEEQKISSYLIVICEFSATQK